MRPSLRFVLPSSDRLMPEPAVGLPELSSGGQNLAQLPLQALLPFLSLANRYRVCPLEFTRTMPSFVLARETVALVLALPATEDAARNPDTPSATASVSASAMRPL